jgi:3-deoxy-D-manno-octulosonate 8-phosphate phosphatase (KDO 8-P phosphatase)
MPISAELRARFAKVRLLLLDVDGVMTDGRLHFDAQGNETKVFHVHDGAGLVYWERAGFLSGFLSGRDSPAVRKRAEDLHVHELHLGKHRKIGTLHEIVGRHELALEEVCYVGDDLLDLEVLQEVGVPVTVPGARPQVKAVCCYVTESREGEGAVRELVELLLDAKGLLDGVVERGGRAPE